MRFGMLVINTWPMAEILADMGTVLQERGHAVVWLVESRLAEFKHRIKLSGPKLYFSDHMRSSETVFDEYKGDPDLWPAMFAYYDRTTELGWYDRSRLKGRDTAARLLDFFLRAIRAEGIDAFVHENVSNAFSHVAYLASQRAGITYLGLATSRLPGRFEIWRDPYGNIDQLRSALEATSIDMIDPKELQEIDHYLDGVTQILPDYMERNRTAISYSYLRHYVRKADWALRALMFLLSPANDLRFSYKEPNPVQAALRQMKRNFMRKMRVPIVRKQFEKVISREDYYVYPLQFHPEASTSVQAPHYVDEEVVIKNVSFSLPYGTMLYVKDHPNAVGFKPLSFYERICRLPNVRLIHYGEDVRRLICGGRGVITLTSSMGYEALLLGRPVYAFGNVFYLAHPHCWKVSNFQELRRLLLHTRQIHDGEDLRAINRRFLKAYRDLTYQGGFVNYTARQLDRIDPLVTAVLANCRRQVTQ